MHNSSPNHLDIEDVFTMGAEQQSRRKSQVNLTGSKEPFNYTNRAIMSFVDALTKMNNEVLVPSRLRDIEVRENDANELMPLNSDLYSFYQMLNMVKKDLFSSSLYYKTFQPNPSANNSGQNSGRVTPTNSLSRRSSYSVGSSNNNTTNGNNHGTNGTSTNSQRNQYSASPTLLMPPNLDRKLSSPSPMMSNGTTSNSGGDNSPDLSPGISSSVLLPSLSLTYVSRATSLTSLLSAAGHMAEENLNNEPLSEDQRIQQITGCFMYHLSALYTIMGHFTKAADYITKRYHEEMDNF